MSDVISNIMAINKRSVKIPSPDEVIRLISEAKLGDEDSLNSLIFYYNLCKLPTNAQEELALKLLNRFVNKDQYNYTLPVSV